MLIQSEMECSFNKLLMIVITSSLLLYVLAEIPTWCVYPKYPTNHRTIWHMDLAMALVVLLLWLTDIYI